MRCSKCAAAKTGTEPCFQTNFHSFGFSSWSVDGKAAEKSFHFTELISILNAKKKNTKAKGSLTGPMQEHTEKTRDSSRTGAKRVHRKKKWGQTKKATTGDQAVKARPGSSPDLLQSSQESVRMHSNVNTQDQYRWHTQTWQYKVCEQQRGLFVYLGLCAFLFRRGLYTISHLKREKKKKKKKAVVVNKTPYWEVNHTQSTSSILSEKVP